MQSKICGMRCHLRVIHAIGHQRGAGIYIHPEHRAVRRSKSERHLVWHALPPTHPRFAARPPCNHEAAHGSVVRLAAGGGLGGRPGGPPQDTHPAQGRLLQQDEGRDCWPPASPARLVRARGRRASVSARRQCRRPRRCRHATQQADAQTPCVAGLRHHLLRRLHHREPARLRQVRPVREEQRAVELHGRAAGACGRRAGGGGRLPADACLARSGQHALSAMPSALAPATAPCSLPKPCRPQVLSKWFGKWRPGVMGMSMDQTANLLWRLMSGEIPRINQVRACVRACPGSSRAGSGRACQRTCRCSSGCRETGGQRPSQRSGL